MKRIEKEIFTANETYSEVTDESASRGDFSDTGFEREDMRYSIEDVLNWVEEHGIDSIQFNFKSVTIYGHFYTSSYRDGIDRQESLHLTGSEFNVRLLERIMDKKCKGM